MPLASFSLRAILTVVGIAAIGRTPMDQRRSGPSAPLADTSLFVSIVESFADSMKPWPIQVDPRPLRADSSVWRVTPATRAVVSPEDLAWRIRALQRLGIPTADAVIPEHCSSVQVPPDPKSDDKSGCPKRGLNVVAVALPRPASGHTSIDSVVMVRVLETALHSLGFSTEVYDYIMARTASGWILQRRIAVGVVE